MKMGWRVVYIFSFLQDVSQKKKACATGNNFDS